MNAPDLIADQALVLTSQWQRETPQQIANRLLWRDQAERWAGQDNISNEQYAATLDAVRLAASKSEVDHG
jgi:hypothetical protein